MIKNNYDTCSTMENIEILCMLDNDISQMNFDGNFKVLRNGGYNTRPIFLFENCQDINYLSDCYDLSNITEKQARDAVIDEHDLKYISVADISSEKEHLDYTWKEYLIELLQTPLDEAFDFYRGLPEYDGAELLVDTIDITGYSQSDFATVIYKKEEGYLSDISKTRETFEQLVYSSPVYCRIDIDGEEYFLDDVDPYEWNLDEVKKEIDTFEISDKAKEYIKDHLPEYPTH